ncbi:MAG: hypothetical protein ACRC3B_05160 [Bacteroidia bacterium]
MNELNFKLTLDEANLIFKALGRMPFNEVYSLIGKMNAQANEQLAPQNANALNGFGANGATSIAQQ